MLRNITRGRLDPAGILQLAASLVPSRHDDTPTTGAGDGVGTIHRSGDGLSAGSQFSGETGFQLAAAPSCPPEQERAALSIAQFRGVALTVTCLHTLALALALGESCVSALRVTRVFLIIV